MTGDANAKGYGGFGGNAHCYTATIESKKNIPSESGRSSKCQKRSTRLGCVGLFLCPEPPYIQNYIYI